jgi:chromosome partitioning protein
MPVKKSANQPAKIIAISQQKGGVGKTTTAINLGDALAEIGNRVLLVDFDPQAALTTWMGPNPLGLETTIYDVLRSSTTVSEIIGHGEKIRCDFVPANIDLAAAEIELVSEPGREYFLKDKLAPVSDEYDYIIIDCPPSLGLLTLNALAAASSVLIPVQTHYFALRGMDLLFETIKKVQARVNPSLRILGILPTLYDSRTKHANEVMQEMEKQYPKLLMKTTIPMTIKLADCTMSGLPILVFEPKSPATDAYRKLAKEVEKRV